MPRDITEKLITLKSTKGFVFTGMIIERAGSISETWEYSLRRVHGAYVSRDRINEFQKAYQQESTAFEDRNNQQYKEKLKKLLEIERKEHHYGGERGFFVVLDKKSDGYYLKPFEIVYKEVKDNKSDTKISLENIPDFEEMASDAAEEARKTEEARKAEDYGLELKEVDTKHHAHYTPDVKPSPAPVQNPSTPSSAGPLTLAQSAKARVAQRTPTSKHAGQAKKFAPIKPGNDSSGAADNALNSYRKKK